MMAENQDFLTEEPTEAKPQKKSMKGWIIGGCAAIGLVMAALLVLFVIFDPFGVIALLFGGGSIAEIVPDDVVVFAEVDFLSLQADDLAEIIEAFQEAAEDIEEVEPETFEEEMEDEFGVTMEDVIPWIGDQVGFALGEFDIDQLEGNEPAPIVLIVEVRDKVEADEFIAKLIEHREDEFDEDFDTFDFDGHEFYESEDEYNPIIMGRYDDYIFLAQEMDFLEDILDLVQEGRRAKGTLTDLDLYQRTLKKLPKDRMLSLYLDYEEIQDVFTEILEAMYYDLGAVSYDITQVDAGLGMSLSVVEAGLQMDVVTMFEDAEDVPWAEMEVNLRNYQFQTPNMVPEETFLFFSNYMLAGQDKNLEDVFGEDYQEAMDLLADEIDIDIEDIYASLEGEIAFALFNQDDGFMSEVLEVPMGLSLLIGINDDSEWEDLFDLLTEEAEYDPMTVVDDVDLDDFDLLSLSMDDGYESYPVIVYGTGKNYAVLSTEVENVEILAAEGDTLADSEDFNQVWQAFPKGTWPVLYLDMAGMVDWVENISDFSSPYGFSPGYGNGTEVDDAAVLEPLTAIAAGSTLYSLPDSRIVTIIFFIER